MFIKVRRVPSHWNLITTLWLRKVWCHSNGFNRRWGRETSFGWSSLRFTFSDFCSNLIVCSGDRTSRSTLVPSNYGCILRMSWSSWIFAVWWSFLIVVGDIVHHCEAIAFDSHVDDFSLPLMNIMYLLPSINCCVRCLSPYVGCNSGPLIVPGKPFGLNTTFGFVLTGQVDTKHQIFTNHRCFVGIVNTFWKDEEISVTPSFGAEERQRIHHRSAINYVGGSIFPKVIGVGREAHDRGNWGAWIENDSASWHWPIYDQRFAFPDAADASLVHRSRPLIAGCRRYVPLLF